MVIIKNEYFCITEDGERIFIQVFKDGFSIKDFQIIAEKYPQIAITKFLVLKEAIEHPTNEMIEFGKLKPKINLFISPDNLEAKITINLDEETFAATKDMIRQEVLTVLNENKIIYGILYDVINNELKTKKEITIAKGLLPEHGADAKVTYLEMPEMKPTLRDDGRVNFYEMNLFQHIKKGDWLGEKISAKSGIQGMNIKGEVLPGKPGKDKTLRYDSNSVEAIEKEGKIILKAKFDGALQKNGGRIGVLNHLVISKNVGSETGNIDFDGYVTIHGTVEDGFSVIATNDISILSYMGLGAVEHIHSKKGNIFIQGGISGRDRSVIEAGKSVFVKFANACKIIATDTIDLGYYALDSNLEADSIFVQAKKGRIIGGTIRAKTKVSLRMVGNAYEKETYINVQGFDRQEIKKQLDALLIKYKELLEKAEQNERELKVYETTLLQFGRIKSNDDYVSYKRIHQEIIDKLYYLEEKRQELLKILSSKGEGEVTIHEKAYPRTLLQIKNLQKRIEKETFGTFYAQDNELIFN